MSNLSQQIRPTKLESEFDEPVSTPLAASLPIMINRDLSLLEFFDRVLQEAADSSKPVLERLKFLAIFSANLDEFFMIRVSGLLEKLGLRVEVSPDGYTRTELLAQIRERVLELIEVQMHVLKDEILPELASKGIHLLKYSELNDAEKEKADRFFDDHVYPTLTPQAVDPTHPFPYISGGAINLALIVRPKLNKRVARAMQHFTDEFFVRIKVPPFIERFVPVDGRESTFILIEDLIAANIRHFAPEAEVGSVHHFRITRDADIALREDEANDLLQMMEQNLKMRRFGDVVRLEVSHTMPREMVEYLMSSLEIEDQAVYRIDSPMNIADAFAITNINRPDLTDKPLRVTMPEAFQHGEAAFDIIKRGDVLLHHPYNPYSIITDLIAEAAEDPDVLAIKMCLYRIGSDSPIAPLLIKASEAGKQVTALIEIKARFDEENNIEWGKRLEQAGVHVVYGLLGLKTHAKTTLIVRREEGRLRRYVHLATGNYNPATSAVYTDLGLLTVDEKIGCDSTELFNYLTVYAQRDEFEKLLVAPLNLRSKMVELIDREIANAQKGVPAGIVAKMNRVADADMVNKLYEASRAGVQIDLIVRGVCTLRPGVPGLSENIRVRSVVGPLLEHSRVYCFENGGEPEVFIGSSDWMPRNLDRRVEVLAPVSDISLRDYLKNSYLNAYLCDNTQARELGPEGKYHHVPRFEGDPDLNCQLQFEEQSNIVQFVKP